MKGGGSASPPVRVFGIDLDNTIIDYDEALHGIAVREGMIPADVPRDKNAVRDHLRASPGGEDRWQRLQALVYGPEIGRAKAMEGAMEFLRECRRREISVFVVSHKSERAAAAPAGSNLRQSALAWLAGHGFFSDETGLSAERVFFGATREEKLALVQSLGCTDFVDDLPDTFADPAFPAGVRRMLLGRGGAGVFSHGATQCASWRTLAGVAFSDFTDTLAAAAKETAAALLGADTDWIRTVKGGRNSRVYQVAANGSVYALNQYFRHPGDDRDRMRTEFGSLELMRAGGITTVPNPLRFSAGPECAIYEWIDGSNVVASAAIEADIDQAVGFLAALRALSLKVGGEWTAPASEARFSVEKIVENVRQRLEGLSRASRNGPSGARFESFFKEDLAPAAERITDWVRIRCEEAGVGYSREIRRSERTLSPSDFGYLNSVRRPNGDLVFLDFEYFGWDDPAKTICDFLFHPAMQLSPGLKTRYVRSALEAFSTVPRLPERVEILYPLIGLKWVVILLNEFLPEHLLRRVFAGAPSGAHEELRLAQLEKAATVLHDIQDNPGQFPRK